MAALTAILGGIAAKVGAELVGTVLGDRFGSAGGELAETVVEEVSKRVGVPPADLPQAEHKELENAVRDVEAVMPEIIALWAKGLDGQFALLEAETREGFWQSAWRWGWMYLLAFFWIWRIIIGPAVNAGGMAIELVDYAVLLTLTTWFISLYMGGHTVKTLGQSAIDAVRVLRGHRP
ncbi:hypothetical protein [Mesorhizobium xinjiangense]|uniref:hypothetical protein n=1 Tax=Mesorhizobium xinjiangense TaxID=2678685 RepID=UPI0012ED072B|nr:hypothetical protein [Mesorhizobium xinjiangense]